MNPSKLYVPDPQEWIKYFKKTVQSKTGFLQSGGGKIIPIDGGKSREQKPNKNELVVERVTPVQQIVDRATGELLRNNIDLHSLKKGSLRRRKTPDSFVTVITEIQQNGGKRVLKRSRVRRQKRLLDTSGF
jgi:hypothetical protein